jgi:hypothetical protein
MLPDINLQILNNGVRTQNKKITAHIFLTLCEFLYSLSVYWTKAGFFIRYYGHFDLLCGLVVRVPGCKPRSLGFDSWCYKIFCVSVGLEWGPLSLMRINEELLERKISGSGLEN